MPQAGVAYGPIMLEHLKDNNRNWAARKVAQDAHFFHRLEGQQAPEYLWIGIVRTSACQAKAKSSTSILANCSSTATSP